MAPREVGGTFGEMAAAYIQANTQGSLHPADQPSLTPLNRGFLYGDAVYEVWRTYHGVIFAWEEHWSRLQRSAASLFLTLPWSREEILAEIRRTVAAYREHTGDLGGLYIRLQIARGEGAIGLDPALADEPVFVILVQSVPKLSEQALKAGLRLALAKSLRRNSPATLNPAWKTGNYLNNIMCLREARMEGADEVVITNLGGEITEAAVSNIAFVEAGTLVTPPLSAGILPGITRHLILTEVAKAAGVSVAERVITPAELIRFDECMLLATTKDVQPVGRIGEQTFQVGPATVSARLKEAFAVYARRYATEHPELSVTGPA